ncbi:hypothetical protein CEXT_631801 [Caerostris extrusa]|uniref:Uncharacterized protein n=1 Tax=Caerostris extrusa TaxID=172846 RepID=A0AAV4UMW0_CAEEX|nr:hypothetical protein CEXT_631801 [Caerostris extrusa]
MPSSVEEFKGGPFGRNGGQLSDRIVRYFFCILDKRRTDSFFLAHLLGSDLEVRNDVRLYHDSTIVVSMPFTDVCRLLHALFSLHAVTHVKLTLQTKWGFIGKENSAQSRLSLQHCNQAHFAAGQHQCYLVLSFRLSDFWVIWVNIFLNLASKASLVCSRCRKGEDEKANKEPRRTDEIKAAVTEDRRVGTMMKSDVRDFQIIFLLFSFIVNISSMNVLIR